MALPGFDDWLSREPGDEPDCRACGCNPGDDERCTVPCPNPYCPCSPADERPDPAGEMERLLKVAPGDGATSEERDEWLRAVARIPGFVEWNHGFVHGFHGNPVAGCGSDDHSGDDYELGVQMGRERRLGKGLTQ